MEAGASVWREHVREALRRRERERGAAGLRALLERHERLRERWEQAQRGAGGGGGGGGGGEPAQEEEEEEEEAPQRGPGCSSSSSLHPHLHRLQRDVAELRREREELRQEVSFLREVLRQREAENQEQRARMGRLAQEAASLAHQYEEAQSKAWALSREAEGLRTELEGARGLLQEAQRDRLDLEARWLEEKAQEARRLNQANEQQEKYRQKVTRLQEKLERMREAAGLLQEGKQSPASQALCPPRGKRRHSPPERQGIPETPGWTLKRAAPPWRGSLGLLRAISTGLGSPSCQ